MPEDVMIGAIRIGLASPEALRRQSSGEVTRPETFDPVTGRPVEGGLFCERIFGPTTGDLCPAGEAGQHRWQRPGAVDEVIAVCTACGEQLTIERARAERRERFGHIELVRPVPHPWFSRGDISPLGRLLGLWQDQIEHAIATDGLVSVLERLQQVDLDALPLVERRRHLVEALRRSGQQPAWLMLRVVPVLPAYLRPPKPDTDVDDESGASNLNARYARLIETNQHLCSLLDQHMPDAALREAERSLRSEVHALFDALTARLTGPDGRLRASLASKQTDFSGRSVAVPDPELGLDQCGLPRRMALELFKPHLAGGLLQQGHAAEIGEALQMVARGGPSMLDALDEVVQGQLVLLSTPGGNGQPLVRAFEVVLADGGAVRVHPLAAALLNVCALEASGDGAPDDGGDGAEVSVQVVLSAAARQEARERLLPSSTLLDPASGEPAIAPSGDVVLGCYLLTAERPDARGQDRRFGSWADAIRAFDLRTTIPDAGIDLQARILVRMEHDQEGNLWEYDPTNPRTDDFGQLAVQPDDLKMVPTTVGRIVLCQTINDALREQSLPPLPFENKRIDKGHLRDLVLKLHREYGGRPARAALEAITLVGLRYATRSGLSIGIDDLASPPEKQTLLADADADVVHAERQFRRGLITTEERYNEVIATWTRTRDAVTHAVNKALDMYGTVALLAWSGARGNIQHISQIKGMGRWASDAYGLIEMPIRSSFSEGLSTLEYFLASVRYRGGQFQEHGRAARARGLLRRLVAAVHQVTVVEEDCGTEEGIWIEDLTYRVYRDTGWVSEPRHDRLKLLVGRYLAADVTDPTSGQVLVSLDEDGTLIDESVRDAIAAGLVPRVSVRSPLSCESQHGVCQRCYGWDRAQRRPVEIGMPVGVVAAQVLASGASELLERWYSYGLPTRRPPRFFDPNPSDDDVLDWGKGAGLRPRAPLGLSGLPRDLALFEAREPAGVAILSDLDGMVEIEHREDGRSITVRSREVYHEPYDLEPGDCPTVSSGDAVVQGQTLATRADGSTLAARWDGTIHTLEQPDGPSGHGQIVVHLEEEDARTYPVPVLVRLRVNNGQVVTAGERLTEGDSDPADILRIQGREAAQQYLTDEIHELYQVNGIVLDRKHIEVIVRQMLRFLRIGTAGDSTLLPGEIVDRWKFETENRQILSYEDREPATAQPVVLGVSEVAANLDGILGPVLLSDDPIALLRQAALAGTVDRLAGPHEQAIVGRLFPIHDVDPSAPAHDRGLSIWLGGDALPSFDDESDDGPRLRLADLDLGDLDDDDVLPRADDRPAPSDPNTDEQSGA
jgi:DNA-directed RNA polymerase subunit beta'